MSRPFPDVTDLPDFGIETLLTCLHENYRRTGQPWFLAAMDDIRTQWDDKRETQ